MSDSNSASENRGFDRPALTALRLGAVLLAILLCYRILAPFISLVLLGAILAIAIYPLHLRLAARLGNRKAISATLITLLGSVLLIAPLILLTDSLVTGSVELAENISEGSVRVPPPPERVKGWPLVGEGLHSTWALASENLSAALQQFGPQLEAVRIGLIAAAGGVGVASLQMLASVIIAGVFLGAAESSLTASRAIMNGLVGERGPLLLIETETTIRSVARGVLGVAIIESILTAIGLIAAGVPAAGFWTFMVLVLSIVQVPPLVVLVPMMVYVLSTSAAFGSTVFIICGVLAIAVDTFLKPVLLGRTADAPVIIVLLGAIGGMMLWGLAGLFAGAVVLVVCWGGLKFWIMKDDAPRNEAPPLPSNEEADG